MFRPSVERRLAFRSAPLDDTFFYRRFNVHFRRAHFFLYPIVCPFRFQFFNKRIEPFSKDHGLVFRSFMYLFRLVQQRQDLHFVLKASFLEIYNEKVIRRVIRTVQTRVFPRPSNGKTYRRHGRNRYTDKSETISLQRGVRWTFRVFFFFFFLFLNNRTTITTRYLRRTKSFTRGVVPVVELVITPRPSRSHTAVICDKRYLLNPPVLESRGETRRGAPSFYFSRAIRRLGESERSPFDCFFRFEHRPYP